jgi:hypothetical protein
MENYDNPSDRKNWNVEDYFFEIMYLTECAFEVIESQKALDILRREVKKRFSKKERETAGLMV